MLNMGIISDIMVPSHAGIRRENGYEEIGAERVMWGEAF